jgi:ubiquinone/menaquinone biosynthesis C-methylase UbiE
MGTRRRAGAQTRDGAESPRDDRDADPRAALLDAGTTDHYEDAALYDFEYKDRTDDVRWYRALARERLRAGGSRAARTVLELGAGTGRIASRLAQDGHHVIALDRMPAMLAALRERVADRPWADAIEIVRAEMTSIPLRGESVGLVIAPFNGLMHLYDWRDLLACFREAARVLVPGGAFAFDVQMPDLEWLGWDPEVRHAVTRFVHPTTGERLVYSTNHTYDQQTQVCHIRIYYDDAPPAGRRFVPPSVPRRLVHLAHRQIFPEELRMLAATAGLDIEQACADFHPTQPLREAEESQVLVCVKP